MSASNRPQVISIAILAMGGEGGGVLSEWLMASARLAGLSAQSTSIPGVAQRTGATTYYIEIWPTPLSSTNASAPVFSLNPVPGALDALVSTELLETVRQIANGLVSPDRTRVFSSSDSPLFTIMARHNGSHASQTAPRLSTWIFNRVARSPSASPETTSAAAWVKSPPGRSTSLTFNRSFPRSFRSCTQ